jgi:phosphinothricin acetyltransferase
VQTALSAAAAIVLTAHKGTADHMKIRPASTGDGEAIARIYNHYVAETIATFEEEPPSPEVIARRIEETGSASLPWLVAERDDRVVGYAYASRWKGRCSYRFAAETTVYLEPGNARKGIGSALLRELLAALKAGGVRSAIAGIALPNDASVALHEKLGFTQVALFNEVGFKFDRWIDVGYWQRTL